jgi:hypothetical protein
LKEQSEIIKEGKLWVEDELTKLTKKTNNITQKLLQNEPQNTTLTLLQNEPNNQTQTLIQSTVKTNKPSVNIPKNINKEQVDTVETEWVDYDNKPKQNTIKASNSVKPKKILTQKQIEGYEKRKITMDNKKLKALLPDQPPETSNLVAQSGNLEDIINNNLEDFIEKPDQDINIFSIIYNKKIADMNEKLNKKKENEKDIPTSLENAILMADQIIDNPLTSPKRKTKTNKKTKDP